VAFNGTDQLLIRYSAFFRHWRKNEYNGAVHELFIDFKTEEKYCTIYSINLGIPMKLVRLIKMCLNEINSKASKGKNLMHFLFRMV